MESNTKVDVCIVGAGFSGLLATIKLRAKGLKSIRILEQAPELGGTWYWNQYPGVACDIESLSYLPLSHLPGYSPERYYSSGASILQFAKQLSEHHNITELINFNEKAVEAKFDVEHSKWTVKSSKGFTYECKYLIFGKGPLSSPNELNFEGLESFKGVSLRTSRWDKSVDLRGKTVGVVGTGASAVQVIPEMAKIAQHLYVFQRTPTYCFPRNDRPIEKTLRREIETKGESFTQKFRIEQNEYADFSLYELFNNERENERTQSRTAEILRARISNPEVAEALIPKYPLGCKRACITDDYWKTFNRDNVTLVADPEGVKSVTESGVLTGSGCSVDLDAIVWATGFDVAEGYFKDTTVIGVNKKDLKEEWSESGIHSLFGMMVNGFPNMFVLLGPQGFNGHANACEIIEVQTDWVAHVISACDKDDGSGFPLLIHPTQEGERAWVENCNRLARSSVWSKCSNWYNGNGKGVVTYTGRWCDYVKALCANTSTCLEAYSVAEQSAAPFDCPTFNVSTAKLPLKLRSKI
mmetsp:Transcript_7473/g.9758  ORF Transcript_7473/g.9758 Transcript_7473/m.9758 type:complete len:525 (-) Transcript_7473:1618-3192(-)